ncbi:phosphoribosyltransferase family protein [Stackebrandtia albiflava]|nr:phosphoribosyltransferase family protein [Stackebrandtia albiflava]
MTEGGDSWWRAGFHRLRDLVVPDECGGCGGRPPPGRAVCEGCRAVLAGSPVLRRRLPGLVVLSGWPYQGVARSCLLAFKDGGRRDLAGVVAARLARLPVLAGPEPVVLVPVPSTRRARRRRGFDHAATLAARVAAGRPGTWWVPALGSRDRPDSAGLSATHRRSAAEAATYPRRSALSRLRRLGRGSRIVLVDDIVTTGAALTAARRALRREGLLVNAAITGATALRRVESDPDLMMTSAL